MNDTGMPDSKMCSNIGKGTFAAAVPGKIDQHIELHAGQPVFFVLSVKSGFQLVVYFLEVTSWLVHAMISVSDT